jgi:tight adherence protein B
MMTTLTILAAGIAVAALIGGVAAVVLGRGASAAEDRLDTLAGRSSRGAAGANEDSGSLLNGNQGEKVSGVIGQVFGELPGLQAWLEQADLNVTPSKFIAVTVGLGVVGAAATLVSPLPWYLAPISAVLLATLPPTYLYMKRKRRLGSFGRQLPEALELLSRSLKAGHSLAAGFGLIGSEMQDPIRREFARAFEEQNLGVSLEEALDGMTDRVPNMDLRFFATAVILQRTTGGDLAEILNKIGRLIRERIQIQGQIQALTGEGRLSGIVLLALPPVLFLVMMFLNPEYAMMLFTDPLGRKMLAGALVMQLLGAIAIRKIIQIKV